MTRTRFETPPGLHTCGSSPTRKLPRKRSSASLPGSTIGRFWVLFTEAINDIPDYLEVPRHGPAFCGRAGRVVRHHPALVFQFPASITSVVDAPRLVSSDASPPRPEWAVTCSPTRSSASSRLASRPSSTWRASLHVGARTHRVPVRPLRAHASPARYGSGHLSPERGVGGG